MTDQAGETNQAKAKQANAKQAEANTEHVKVSIADGVMTVALTRSEKKNALTVAMYAALVEALKSSSDDDDVRVLHIRGDGRSFTAGNDLVDFMDTPPAGDDSPVSQFLIALSEYPKPILAEVSGPAIGIGVTMLLHCDLIYADETARFRMPFVDLGLCPEGASSFLLPRLMGFAEAGELLFFSEKFDAERAKSCGLISGIVPSANIAEHCAERAKTLAKKAPASLRKTKELLRRPLRAQVKRALTDEGELFMEQLNSAEAREAFTAFFEKREPDFSNL